MSSYAGFQRSDVPQIGKEVAGIMQHQLDTQAKEDLQQKALIAKGIVNDQKLAKENEKTSIEAFKPLNTAIASVPITRFNALNIMGQKLSNSGKTLLSSVVIDPKYTYTDKINAGEGAATAINGMSDYYKQFNKATDNVESKGEKVPPMTKFGFDWANEDLSNPNGYEPSFDDLGNFTYGLSLKDLKTQKNVFNGSMAQNLIAMSNVEPVNYDVAINTLVDNVGDYSVEKSAKGGGTELILDKEHNPKFVNQLNTFTNQLINNPVESGNAIYKLLNNAPMFSDPNNTYKVELIKPRTSNYAKEELAKKRGSEDMKDMLFVEVDKDENGLLKTNLTDEQKALLAQAIKEKATNHALYSKKITHIPSTNGNGNGKGDNNQVSSTLKRAFAGDERAISSMVDQIKPAILKDGSRYNYNPRTKILFINVAYSVDENGDDVYTPRPFNLKNEDDRLYLMRLFDVQKAINVEKHLKQ